MATRNDIQIAQDLIRFVNIMNDLLDCASYILRGKDPQTGGIFQIQEGQVSRDATLDELKENVKRTGQNVLGYRNMLQSFIASYGGKNIREALLSFNVNYDDILADITAMENEARNLGNNIQGCKGKADLAPFADSIDANIPKLVLVRRSWCLGL